MRKKTVKENRSPFLKLLHDPNRFKRLDDGWVRDSLIGLEWGPSSADWMDLQAAKEYCAKLGGRLPEVNELQSLVDYSRSDPAISKDLFPDIKSSWYWTNTEAAGYSGSAWIVLFYNGNVNSDVKDSYSYVRPCRASQ